MLRTKKKQTVVTAQATSATQNAVSQLYRLAMVLNGRPAMNAPTERKKQSGIYGYILWSILFNAFCHETVPADLPFAIRATMACDVPQKLEGALSLAITPNKAIGPYEENPNAAPRIKIQSCRTENVVLDTIKKKKKIEDG